MFKNYNILINQIWTDYTLFIPKNILYWSSDGERAFVIFIKDKNANSKDDLFFVGKNKIVPYNTIPNVDKFFLPEIILKCMKHNKTTINTNHEIMDIHKICDY